MPEHLLDGLDVFYGELTPARATVYARLEGLENYERLTLSGFVQGPRCFYSKTLPASFRLQDAGPGPTLLAKTIIPDPSYWSPDTPHIYDVIVELRKGGEIIASEVRQIGFKPLGISGRFFTWEGKSWVLRGVSQYSTAAQDILLWRKHSAVLVRHPITEAALQKASEQGVLCYCGLPVFDCTRENDVLESMRRLARFPAVAFVGNQWSFRKKLQRAAPNILIVEGVPHSFPIRVGYGADPTALLLQGATQPLDDSAILAVSAQQTSSYLGQEFSVEAEVTRWMVPVLIRGSLPHPKSFGKARRTCDKLQADIARYGQFAGYII